MLTTRNIILSALGAVFMTGSTMASPNDTTSLPRYVPSYNSTSVSSWIRKPGQQKPMQLAQQERFPPIGFDPSRPDARYKQPDVLPVWPSAPSAVKQPVFELPKLAEPIVPPAASGPLPPSSSGLYGKNTAPPVAQPLAAYAGNSQPGVAYGYQRPPAPVWDQPRRNPWAAARPPQPAPRPQSGAAYAPWRGNARNLVNPRNPAANTRRNPWAQLPAANGGNTGARWGKNAFNRIESQPKLPRYANPWPPKAQNPAANYNYGYPSQFRANERVNPTNRGPWNFNGAYPNFGWGGGSPW